MDDEAGDDRVDSDKVPATRYRRLQTVQVRRQKLKR